jgi:hypothetical protein
MIFFADDVIGVKNLNACFLDLCLWSDQFEFMAVLMVFNLRIGPGFILSLVANLIYLPYSCYYSSNRSVLRCIS